MIPSVITETNYRLISGGVAGIVSRTFVAPIERIIILRQTNDPLYFNKKLLQTLKSIYQNGGIRSLFKGNLANSFRIAPFQAIEFCAFDLLKKNYVPQVSKYIGGYNSNLIAGALSGALAVIVVYPFDLTKTILAMQHQSCSDYKGIMGTMFHVIKSRGFFALWRGVSATMIGMAPYSGLKLSFFQMISQGTNHKYKYLNLVYGSISGCMALTITYPGDVIRRRLQAQIIQNNVQLSYIQTVKTMYQKQGIGIFYYGIIATYVKVMPSTGIAFYLNEKFKSFRNYQ